MEEEKEHSFHEVHHHKEHKRPFTERFSDFYHKNYKLLFLIPMLLLLLAILQISFQTATTGDFIKKGIAFTGGTSIGVDTDYSDVPGLESELRNLYPEADINTRIVTRAGKQEAIIIEANREVKEEELVSSIRSIIAKSDISVINQEFNIQEFSPEFATDFFKTTMIAVIVAFIFMAITVALYFRVMIPSVAVVFAAFSDIVITIAIFNLLGQRLAPGGIAAFLMLIGYSVDTDILLSTRTLKEKIGTVSSRINNAFRTGIIMSVTSIGAVAVAYIFSQADILKQIMLVLFIGLCVDIIVTWFQNGAIIKWYFAKRGKY